jgi:hypothetical protein
MSRPTAEQPLVSTLPAGARSPMNDQRLHELEELYRQAREIKLHRLSEEDGNFLRSLHYKSVAEFTREEQERLRSMVKLHWRREE